MTDQIGRDAPKAVGEPRDKPRLVGRQVQQGADGRERVLIAAPVEVSAQSRRQELITQLHMVWDVCYGRRTESLQQRKEIRHIIVNGAMTSNYTMEHTE